jgi:GxxExxY protein
MIACVTDPLARLVIGAAIDVHREIGPGLLESAYQRCLAHELRLNGVAFQEQLAIPVCYKGLQLDCGYRADFVIEGRLVIELKTVDRFLPVHSAQVLTYLKLLGVRHGLLMNFHLPRLADGLKSILYDKTPDSSA